MGMPPGSVVLKNTVCGNLSSCTLLAYARSPRMRRASCISFGMMVTLLAWIAHRLVSATEKHGQCSVRCRKSTSHQTPGHSGKTISRLDSLLYVKQYSDITITMFYWFHTQCTHWSCPPLQNRAHFSAHDNCPLKTIQLLNHICVSC